MKTAWNIIAIVAVLNLLLLLGFVGWLYQSQRLDRARLDTVVTLIKPTIPEHEAKLEEERKKEEALRLEQEKIAHLKKVEQGPVTMFDRLSADQQADELAMHKLARLQSEIKELHMGLDSQNRQLAMERQQLIDDRKAYEDYRAQREAMLKAEDFRRVINTLEQVKAAQAKLMMEDLVRQGKTDQVVEYLAAMDLRKSAAVLREFKTPQEISAAAGLIEKLRTRQAEAARKASTEGNNG